MRRREARCAGFARPFLLILIFVSAPLSDLGWTEKMFDSGAFPIIRLALGYPERISGQAGLALTRLTLNSPFLPLSQGIPYVAFQAGIKGFQGIVGLTNISFGNEDAFPFLITYGIEYGQEWRQLNVWTMGPVIQLGFFYVGVQAAIRFAEDPKGEAFLLFHIFPPD
jgi:hypothetical protein